MPEKEAFDIKAYIAQFEQIYPETTPENALELIARTSGISTHELIGKGRAAPISFWRQALFYVLREKTDLSFGAIAETYAPGKKLSDVRNGHKTMKDLLSAYGKPKQ